MMYRALYRKWRPQTFSDVVGQSHITVIPSAVDKTTYRKLGLNLTCEPVYATKRLYHK